MQIAAGTLANTQHSGIDNEDEHEHDLRPRDTLRLSFGVRAGHADWLAPRFAP
jgi:hypothetical protein